jgi:DNA-binding MarR family transcriptional regulator
MHAVEPLDHIESMRAHLRERLHALTGEDHSSGMEIAHLIRVIGNQYETIGDQEVCPGGGGISAPRWALLMRLAAEEDHGNHETTPTELSRSQNVTKNTISALLRGLEDQGLISRELDADDRRVFRIRLTPAGRELLRSTAPQRIAQLNQFASHLNSQEQNQLIDLLGKLYCSLVKEMHHPEVL